MLAIEEHQARKGILFLFIYFFAWLAYAAFTDFVSFDTFWHLRMGEDFLFGSLSPGIDHYSFTHYHEPIAGAPVLFQSIAGLFSASLGVPLGPQMLRLVGLTLFLGAIFLFYRTIRANWAIIALTLPFIALFYLFRFQHVRPEMFGNLFVVLALILCIEARRDFSHRNLALIAGFMLLWVNYHVAILGYVIFFGLFVDKAVDLVRKLEERRLWIRWSIWGAVIFLLGFANPDMSHTLFDTIRFSGEWMANNEFRATREVLANNSLLTGFWLVCVYVVLALAWQNKFGLAIVCAIYAFQSWEALRFLTLSGVVVLCLAAHALTDTDFRSLFASVKQSIRVLLIATAIAISLTGMALSSVQAFEIRQLDNAANLPSSIVGYLQENHPGGGNIFNRVREGGFLLYHLAPEFRVYIDGRVNILYPAAFTQRHLNLYYYTGSGGSLSEELHKYDVDFAIYPIEFGRLLITDPSHDLDLELVSDRYVLFSTAATGFPVTGRLLYFPMCWDDQLTGAVVPEIARAEQVLPPNSGLLPLIRTLQALMETGSQDKFTNPALASLPSNDYHGRLLAYLALENGRNADAARYFELIQNKETLDLLMFAVAETRRSNHALAAELLVFTLSEAWTSQYPYALNELEMISLVSLYDQLRRQVGFPLNVTSRIEGLRQTLLGKNPDRLFALDQLDPGAICASVMGKASS